MVVDVEIVVVVMVVVVVMQVMKFGDARVTGCDAK